MLFQFLYLNVNADFLTLFQGCLKFSYEFSMMGHVIQLFLEEIVVKFGKAVKQVFIYKIGMYTFS